VEEGEVEDGEIGHEGTADIPSLKFETAPDYQDTAQPEPGNWRSVDALTEESPPSFFDTLATLDMVISVVGDFYGQRDLLAGRKEVLYKLSSR
jgi:hypothetical protein